MWKQNGPGIAAVGGRSLLGPAYSATGHVSRDEQGFCDQLEGERRGGRCRCARPSARPPLGIELRLDRQLLGPTPSRQVAASRTAVRAEPTIAKSVIRIRNSDLRCQLAGPRAG